MEEVFSFGSFILVWLNSVHFLTVILNSSCHLDTTFFVDLITIQYSTSFRWKLDGYINSSHCTDCAIAEEFSTG